MSSPQIIIGQPVPVASLPEAMTPAGDDFVVLEGTTNGTRKIASANLVPVPLATPPTLETLPEEIRQKLLRMSVAELSVVLLARGLLRQSDIP